MKILCLVVFLILCTGNIAFQYAHGRGVAYTPQILTRQRSMTSLAASTSDSDDSDRFDVFNDELEETVLRMNFRYDCDGNDEKGNLALSAIQDYTRSFPFAAVLPVQPLTYLPLNTTDGNPAVKVTFLRKKTAEKGSQDGGLLFSSCLVSEEDWDEDGELDNYKKNIQLTAWRITSGQTISKVFSEKQIIVAFVKGLSEGNGKELLKDGNVEVESVFHLWM